MNYVINYYMSAFQNFGISIHISSHTRYLSKAEQQRLFLLFLRNGTLVKLRQCRESHKCKVNKALCYSIGIKFLFN